MNVAQSVPSVPVRTFTITHKNAGNKYWQQEWVHWGLLCKTCEQHHFVYQGLGITKHSFSGVNSRGLLVECRFLEEGIWLRHAAFLLSRQEEGCLISTFLTSQLQAWLQRYCKQAAKPIPCSSRLHFSKSTLRGNTEMAKTVGIVKAGGYRGKKEINPQVIKLFVKSTFRKLTSSQSEHPRDPIKMLLACVRTVGFKSPCCPENQVSKDFWALFIHIVCMVLWEDLTRKFVWKF